MADWVSVLSLVAGSLCLGLFIWAVASAIPREGKAIAAAAKTVVSDPKSVTVPEFTALMEALTKLTEALGKASPTIVSLIGAIAFYAIAAVASGALVTAPAKPAPECKCPGPGPGGGPGHRGGERSATPEAPPEKPNVGA
jgi:hypothetical protein